MCIFDRLFMHVYHTCRIRTMSVRGLFFAFILVGLYSYPALGQSDAAIKEAKNTATSAGLKKYQKFSPNDSIHWLYGGDATLSFTATSLSNWASGGEDQLGIASVVNVFANYKKGKRTFENYGTFAYGILKTGNWKAVKGDDKIYLVSKAGHQMSPKWYYAASLLVRTQFAPGYKYSSTDTIKVSDFLAPLYLYLSIGLDYRPSNNFSSVFSPLMGKATFARSDNIDVLSNAGLVETVKNEAGEKVFITHHSRYEFGGGLIMSINGNLLNNKISYNSQLELFSNYMENPENIDISWALQLKFLIYKNISADVRVDMRYDDDQKTIDQNGLPAGPKLQIKSYFGVGIFYQF